MPAAYLMIIVDETHQEEENDTNRRDGHERRADGTKIGGEMGQDGKDAFGKLRYKQNMWRVYKHTGKDNNYEVYKEALNAATNEVRKAKRNFEHKLTQNIKSDSKTLTPLFTSRKHFVLYTFRSGTDFQPTLLIAIVSA